MSGSLLPVAVLAVYLALVLAVALGAGRPGRRGGAGEEYFLAGRTIGPVLLLLTLFGTHMTAFSLLGASGEAYRRGIGVFALMASSSALVVPAVFLVIGTRLWALGRRHGYRTQVQYFRDRWGSPALGTALFVTLTALLIPYLLIGIKGGGITLTQLTDGRLPEWVGSLAMSLVVLVYVTRAGARGTTWANAFQTLVFLVLGLVTFAVLVRASGGWGESLARIGELRPDLLVRTGHIRPLELLSYTLIPLSVGMFPHIFMHWLTARRAATFRLSVTAYPLFVAAVWLPSVLLGVLGATWITDLEGPAASSVLVRLIALQAPGILAGLLGAGVFAAVMSSLDSQILALATLFTHDLVERVRPLTEAQRVRTARLFVVGLLALCFLLALVVDRSLFKLGVWSFSGFAALVPLAVAALFWRRSTARGAFAGLAVTAGLWVYFLARAWNEPGYTVGGTGVLPVAVMVAASSLAVVLGSLLSPPPDPERLAKFFPPRQPLRETR